MLSAKYSAATAAFFSLIASTNAVYDAASNKNLVVYYGQGNNQTGLAGYCDATEIDVIPIGFINLFPAQADGLVQENFGNNCWGGAYYTGADGEPSPLYSRCPQLQEDIYYCQTQTNKKILLSLGGDAKGYQVTGKDEGVALAEFLWGAYGPYNQAWVDAGGVRPLDRGLYDTDATKTIDVDGFDFDIEIAPTDSAEGYIACINRLRELFATASKKYIISGAPQCPIPEPNMGAMIAGAQFDLLWVQFYNNDAFGCSARQWADANPSYSGVEVPSGFNYNGWTEFLAQGQSSAAKLYIGLPASTVDATSADYLTPDEAEKLVSAYQGKSNFGGVMLYEATGATENVVPASNKARSVGANYAGLNYYQVMREILDAGAPTTTSTSSSSLPTSTSSSSSSTSTSVSAIPTPTTVPSVGQCSFIGCYTETAQFADTPRTLPDANTDDYTDMSVEICAAFCSGYAFFGVEYGGECYCGNSINPLSTISSTDSCNAVCDGTPDEFCGGGNLLDVYQCGAPVTSSSTSSSMSSTSSTSSSVIPTSTSSSSSSSTTDSSTSSTASSTSSSSTTDSSTSSTASLTSSSSTTDSSTSSTASSTSSSSTTDSSTSSTASSTTDSSTSSTASSTTDSSTSSSSTATYSSSATTTPTSSASVSTSSSSTSSSVVSTSSSTSVAYNSTTSSSIPSSTSSSVVLSSTSSSNGSVTSTASSTSSFSTLPPYGNSTSSSATSTSAPITTSSSTSYTISTVYTTSVYTITSCAATVTDCPARTGQLTTETISLYTTLCPVTATQTTPVVTAAPTPTQYTTSTVYVTSVYTITSCAATVTDCPARIGQVTTETISSYTTVCPVTATETPAGPATTPVTTPVPTQYTTSTVYATSVYTITSCAPSVTNCPAQIGQVTTDIISLYTTVCPVTATETSSTSTYTTTSTSYVTVSISVSTATVVPVPSTASVPLSSTATPASTLSTATVVPVMSTETVIPVQSSAPYPTGGSSTAGIFGSGTGTASLPSVSLIIKPVSSMTGFGSVPATPTPVPSQYTAGAGSVKVGGAMLAVVVGAMML